MPRRHGTWLLHRSCPRLPEQRLERVLVSRVHVGIRHPKRIGGEDVGRRHRRSKGAPCVRRWRSSTSSGVRRAGRRQRRALAGDGGVVEANFELQLPILAIRQRIPPPDPLGRRQAPEREARGAQAVVPHVVVVEDLQLDHIVLVRHLEGKLVVGRPSRIQVVLDRWRLELCLAHPHSHERVREVAEQSGVLVHQVACRKDLDLQGVGCTRNGVMKTTTAAAACTSTGNRVVFQHPQLDAAIRGASSLVLQHVAGEGSRPRIPSEDFRHTKQLTTRVLHAHDEQCSHGVQRKLATRPKLQGLGRRPGVPGRDVLDCRELAGVVDHPNCVHEAGPARHVQELGDLHLEVLLHRRSSRGGPGAEIEAKREGLGRGGEVGQRGAVLQACERPRLSLCHHHLHAAAHGPVVRVAPGVLVGLGRAGVQAREAAVADNLTVVELQRQHDGAGGRRQLQRRRGPQLDARPLALAAAAGGGDGLGDAEVSLAVSGPHDVLGGHAVAHLPGDVQQRGDADGQAVRDHPRLPQGLPVPCRGVSRDAVATGAARQSCCRGAAGRNTSDVQLGEPRHRRNGHHGAISPPRASASADGP
mmetsp:Transcript_56294/g.182811  ORF Transcript_56294/g.182811 Transcript_56294/m.182811 type:complete len:586 (-) Transcript_56294:179-1936(-)